jgi:SAM-dependent methyltransferase
MGIHGGDNEVLELCGRREALRAWFADVLGSMLLEQEQAALDEVLQDLFGYYLLQLGWVSPRDILTESRIRMRVVMDVDRPGGLDYPYVRAMPEMVPVQSDSLDVVVLQHILEFSNDPHEVLREVDRMLIPEGHVVIVAFNPWSYWGLWRLLRRRRSRRFPWCGRFLGVTRMKDWMGLLGFDTVQVIPLFFRPPIRHQGVMRRLRFLDKAGARAWPLLAGVNIVVAQKRVATLTPIKLRRWRLQRRLVVDVVKQPTSGSVGNG